MRNKDLHDFLNEKIDPKIREEFNLDTKRYNKVILSNEKGEQKEVKECLVISKDAKSKYLVNINSRDTLNLLLGISAAIKESLEELDEAGLLGVVINMIREE